LKVTIFILTAMILLAIFTGPIRAEDTDRERLARIETKMDIIIEQVKGQNERISAVERRSELHGTYWGVFFTFMGISSPVIVGLIVKAVGRYIKAPPLKTSCQED
jgi:hypothetical protein